MSQEQIVNAPNLYLDGLNLARASNTTLTVSVGQCRDSTNVLDMFVTSTLTINGAINGANGLDTGTLAASTVYYVYLISDLQGFNPTAALISTSPNSPHMPYGYGAIRKLGRVLTDGSGNFLLFYSTGLGRDKYIQLDSLLTLLTNGTSTSFAAINCLIGIGGSSTIAMSTPVTLVVTYTPNNVNNLLSIRPTGSSASDGNTPVVIRANVNSGVLILSNIQINPGINSGVSSIDYIVDTSDSVNIFLAGFVENL